MGCTGILLEIIERCKKLHFISYFMCGDRMGKSCCCLNINTRFLGYHSTEKSNIKAISRLVVGIQTGF